MRKLFVCALVISSGFVFAQKESGAQFHRNNGPAENAQRIRPATRGTGLAPTTWGFVSKYSGTLYGSGYYPFRVDYTYAGTNSLFGYTFNYPSIGFVNSIKAIYAFDISGIAGQPGPIWSSFMFDVRENPPSGSSGLSVFAQIALEQSGMNYALTGSWLFQGNGATNLDIYDAEEFENNDPFASPQLAFTGNNPLIGTVPVTTNTVGSLNFDVTNAVQADLGPLIEIPTMGTYGLIIFLVALSIVALVFIRKTRSA